MTDKRNRCFLPLRDKSQIRLLSLSDDCVAENDGPISCKHTVVSLQDAPSFTALSYVWGSASSSYPILLNNSPIEIFDNLHAFLAQYQSKHDTGYLWIDALCINQADLPERSQQVKIMGNIYSAAQRVITWLGADASLAQALTELAQTREWLKIFHTSGFADDLDPPVPFLPEKFAALDAVAELVTQEDWCRVTSSVDQICQNQYWTRMWVVQESVLARNVDIWCAHATLSFAQFALHFRLACGECAWLSRNDDENDAFKIIHLGTKQSPARRIVEARRHRLGGNVRWAWSASDALFSKFDDAQCQDVRDRVYGLLGLVDNKELEQFPIHPDYEISTSDLFLQLCERRVNQYQTLGTLRGWGPLGGFALALQLLLELQDDDRNVVLVRERVRGDSKSRGKRMTGLGVSVEEV